MCIRGGISTPGHSSVKKSSSSRLNAIARLMRTLTPYSIINPVFCLKLPEIGSPVCDGDEGYFLISPGVARIGGIGAILHIERIEFSLVDGSRYILAFALCLDNTDQSGPGKQGIVSAAFCNRPFGDSETAALGRAYAAAVTKVFRIGLPAAVV